MHNSCTNVFPWLMVPYVWTHYQWEVIKPSNYLSATFNYFSSPFRNYVNSLLHPHFSCVTQPKDSKYHQTALFLYVLAN